MKKMDVFKEELKDQWSSLDDISLLQQSMLDTHDESSFFLGPEGMQDLTCSLINCSGMDCEGDHDADAQAEAVNNDAEKLCIEIMNRDKTKSALFNTLTTIVKQGENGDIALSSVKSKMTFLHKEIEKLRGLKSGAGGDKAANELNGHKQTTSRITTPCANTETQTELSIPDVVVQKDVVSTLNKSVQCTLKFQDSKTAKQHHQNQTNYIETVKVNTLTQTCDVLEQKIQGEETEENANNVQHNKSFDSDDFNMDHKGSPNRLEAKDMFRLTFSPSICEYEAEAHSGYKKGEHDLIIEDLKLQVNDRDRKFEATKKFLEEMTAEREQEREDYQRTINDLVIRCEEGKKEKDKLEAVVLRQRLEIEDLTENVQDSFRIKNEVLTKSLSVEHELKNAVEKICELRDIIRALEEQVEEATRHATLHSYGRIGISEESVIEELSKNTEIGPPHEDASELDITVELQAQVQELARRIDEKLIELENFSWHTRPGSSCSVKSGDDVSVRAADGVHLNDDNIITDQDLVSQVFCGLRRLECNFDSLVRFEEMLIKKIKDADLKVSMDSKRVEELTRENSRLSKDLRLCRQKILDFENFMSETKKTYSETSIPKVEALRAGANTSIHRFEESSPVIKRPRVVKGQMETDQQPQDDMAELDQQDLHDFTDESDPEEYGFDEDESNVANPDQNQSNPNGGGMMDKQDGNSPAESGADEFSNAANLANDKNDEPLNTDATAAGTKNGPSSNGKLGDPSSQGNNSNPGKTGSGGMLDTKDGGPNTPLSGLVLETTLGDDSGQGGLNPGTSGQNPTGNSGPSGPRRGSSGNDGSKSGPSGNKDGSGGTSTGPGGKENDSSKSGPGNSGNDNSGPGGNSGNDNSEPGGNSGNDNSGPGENSGNDDSGPGGNSGNDNSGPGENSGNDDSGPYGNSGNDNSGPGENFGNDNLDIGENSGNDDSGPFGNSGNDNSGPGGTKSGQGWEDPMNNPQNNGADNLLDRGLPNDDNDVITFDVTTVSDYEVDGENLKYIGSKILPPEDSFRQSDDQLNRLEGMDAKLELEKMKTKLDQIQKALEAERQKTHDLAQQLDDIVNRPEEPNDEGMLAKEFVGDEPDENSEIYENDETDENDEIDESDENSLEEYMEDLERTLSEKEQTECKLKRALDCATQAYHQLQEENEELKEYVDQLEEDLDAYKS